MANNERLTKRVKKIEEWMAMNEGGPTLDNLNYLIGALSNTQNYAQNLERQHNTLIGLNKEFLEDKDLVTDWDAWLEEKHNAVQKQQTEEVSVQEEAESSEEVSEAHEEEAE